MLKSFQQSQQNGKCTVHSAQQHQLWSFCPLDFKTTMRFVSFLHRANDTYKRWGREQLLPADWWGGNMTIYPHVPQPPLKEEEVWLNLGTEVSS